MALADDLSGAAETAVALATRGSRRSTGVNPQVQLQLWQAGGSFAAPQPRGTDGPGTARQSMLVIDTDSRDLPADAAERRIGRILAQRLAEGTPRPWLIKKIDSQLRGNIAAELTPLLTAGGIVLAPALPAAGRTVRGGAVFVDGVPLASVGSWRTEPSTPPGSVSAAIAPLASASIPLSLIRGSHGSLSRCLARTLSLGKVAICDAETDEDLDRIVAAAQLESGPPPVLAGTAAIAAATARRTPTPAREPGGDPLPIGRRNRHLLIVVGSAESTIVTQLSRLHAAGIATIMLDPRRLSDDPARITAQIGNGLQHGPLAVGVGKPFDPGRRSSVAAALAAAIARTRTDADLVLIGGETGRRVLDALGIQRLRFLGPVAGDTEHGSRTEYGVSRSITRDGRMIITRPGSFGGPDSLVNIITAVGCRTGRNPTRERKA